jgi:16S rRNA (cytosine1402-N4)-methyltransferase
MHISVLIEETLKYLNLKEDSVVVDMTLGYGGHSGEILKRIKKGFLFAFDQDQDAIDHSEKKLSEIASNYKIIKSNFVNIKEKLKENNIDKVDAILFDLGVSSPQLDQGDRGFSFHQDAYLDMRMDKDNKIDATYIVNNYNYDELINIFYKYGEEKYSSSIAKKIIQERSIKKINTTLQLVEIIKSSVPEKYKREKHPARKIFQALRIEVNKELEVFEKALKDSLDLLSINGRICVITFHSLEDKICKEIFKKVSKIDSELNKLPIIPEEYLPRYKIIKTIEPSKKELEVNNRSRSAKLRVIEKVKE